MRFFKKLFSLVLCISILSSVVVISAPQQAYADEETGIVYGDVSGDLIVKMDDVVLLQKYIAKIEKLTTTQLKLADVNNSGEIKMDDVVDIQSYIAGLLSSFEADKIEQDYISRIEWISELVYAMGLKMSDLSIENAEIAFKDVTDPIYIEDLKYAVTAGIVDQSSRLFEPDAPAKREFVAVTVVNALGFYGDYPLECSDADAITDKKSVAIALKTNYLALKNGKFFPDTNITETEMNGIIYKIDLLELSTKISDQYNGIINYKENVMLADKDAEYVVQNNTFRVATALLGNAGVGDIYILPADDMNPTGHPCKIKNITYDGLFAICEYETPQLGEIYSKINSQGYGEADLDRIEAVDESVEYEAQSATQMQFPEKPRKYDFNDSDSLKLFDTVNFSLKDFKVKDGLTVTGSIILKKPTISYSIDADISLDEVDIRNFYIDLKKDLEFECTVKATSAVFTDTPTSVQIAKIPFALGTTGLFVDMIISLKVSVAGNITVSYTFGDVTGIQIKDNVPRYVHSVNNSECNFEAKAELSAGAEIKLKLSAFEIINILNISVGAGLKMELGNYEYHDFTVCKDACIWLYANVGVTSELLTTDWLTVDFKWSLFSKSNSPFRWDIHLEGNMPVDECSFKEAEIVDFEYELVNDDAVIWECEDSDVTNLTIPSEIDGHKVIGISEGTFYGLANLENVVIPETVISIENRAFYGCTSLKSITIPDGVRGISERAFEGCKALKKVYISDTVTNIGKDAFKGCNENLVLYGKRDGYAHKYAISNTIAFVSIR